MQLTFKQSHRPLQPGQIEAFEAANRVTIPPAVRELLLAHNGATWGPLDYPAFKIPSGRPTLTEGVLKTLFCLHEGEVNDLGRVFRTHLRRIPDELLPIGCDPAGNLICVGLNGDHAGKIYFWERAKEHRPPTFSNVYRLADDLSAFLDGLYPPKG